jgi:centromere protein I
MKSTIPMLRTSHATEDSVTLEEIESAASFVRNLEKLELPNQLVAVLADPLLQKLLMLRPSAESDQRIANWLNSLLQDVLEGDTGEDALWEALSIVRDYVARIKTLPDLFLNFLARFFQIWSGAGHRDTIFEILTYTPLLRFEGMSCLCM